MTRRKSQAAARAANGRKRPEATSDPQAAPPPVADEQPVPALSPDAAPPDSPIVAESDGTPPEADVSPAEERVAAQPAPVLIDLDPALSGGFIHGRFDVLIRGRVLSPAAIEEVALHVADETVTRTQFGQPDRAAASAMPDGTPARQSAFQFYLPRPEGRAAEPCVCRIVARTFDGQTHAQDFDLAMDPGGTEPVKIVAGVARTRLSEAGVTPPAVLYVEQAEVDGDGHLHVHGWVVSLTPIVTVQVFAGDTRISAARLGGERDDVANAYAVYPNARLSGFTLGIQLPESERSATAIKVQAICLHGFSHDVIVPLERVTVRPAGVKQAAPAPASPPPTLPPPTLPSVFPLLNQAPIYQIRADFRIAPDPSPSPGAPGGVRPPAPARTEAQREIRMFVDNAALAADGRLEVSGWAVSGAGIARVSVELDEGAVGLAEFGHERPDVGEEYADIPMAGLSGFRFDKRVTDRAGGAHAVRVVVRNALGDEKAETVPIEVAGEPAPSPQVAADPAPSPADQQEFRFELDSPPLVADAVVEPVSGRLTIEGWVLARSGVAGIDVLMDGQRLGEAHYGLARQDVGSAFPDWDNSVRSGYAFHCPPRSLRDGAHVVQLVVRSRNGQEFTRQFHIDVKKAEDQDDLASIRRRVSRVEADLHAGLLDSLDHHPAFRLLLRQAGPVDPDRVLASLDALRHQAHAAWELRVLAADDESAAALRALVQAQTADIADRITVIGPDDGEAWDAPIAAPDDPATILYGLLCPGDLLGADALAEFALAGGLHPEADFLYADEARLSPVSREREPFFKPDFSPDLLLSTNYIGRPWVAAGPLLAALGATPRTLMADGEYDLVLRATERARAIHHLPKLLCQRGPELLDDAATGAAALARAATRRGITADIVETPIPGTWRFRRAVPALGKVSIIIPTCAAHGYIETCITSLRERTSYRDFEIICIDNIPDSEMAWKIWLQQNADKTVDIPAAFNWSRFNNQAAEAAEGEFLLFLNDDIEIVQEDWLETLLEHAQRPEVGIVGPQLLYPDRKVQHAGMFLAANGIGRHAFRFADHDDPGYFGLALTQRNVIAVTGACMLMRRETFERLGRFDEAHEIVNNDLDFCLRAHQAGLLTVFTPHATLIHYELASRDRLKDVFDLSHFNAHWKTLFAAGDPYFSPRLSRHADDYRPDDEAMEIVYPGNPLFSRDEIRRILVVKLDHIGDFVTSLPAIRRLKREFPQAAITVLAGRAAQAFADVEDSIDAFLEFEFFHARSGLGQKTLTQDDYQALGDRLRPYRFDLAIDLRKHLDTREVLRHTSARLLAGFDHRGQFPFLDIAVEWEGDSSLHRKRAHVVDDLLGLVSAVASAGRAERTHLSLPHGASAAALSRLPDPARALFDKPVVAIHPGVGTIMRQWPASHFASLIDLLAETNGVNAVLIGGPDEAELAEEVLAGVVNRASVESLVGKTPLRDLPGLLAACALYVGNNSGPKHIAAALGVPTIGIHSGVVDATEWGPIGPRAVAVRRNMTCSPCYLARMEDCPRSLACLRLLEPAHVHRVAEALLARPVPRRAAAAESPSALPADAGAMDVPEPDAVPTGAEAPPTTEVRAEDAAPPRPSVAAQGARSRSRRPPAARVTA